MNHSGNSPDVRTEKINEKSIPIYLNNGYPVIKPICFVFVSSLSERFPPKKNMTK